MPEKHKLPIYMIEEDLINGFPPERFYSTYPGCRSPIVGHIVSEHRLERAYQGTWGASHWSPVYGQEGFYSARSLLICARENRFGLSWESIRSEADK